MATSGHKLMVASGNRGIIETTKGHVVGVVRKDLEIVPLPKFLVGKA